MDTFTLLDIDMIALTVRYKYKSTVMYLWLVPGEILSNSLRPLQCTEHIFQFFEHPSYWKTIDIYLYGTPLWSIVRLTNMIPSTTFVYELEVGDSGFETDYEIKVVLVKGPVLMLEYVHDQGDGYVGGVVAPGGDVDGVMGPSENLDGVVGPGGDVDGVVCNNPL
ncbi:hypothetical protein LIER_36626 [Lithospermum erythrorhizon]|uniref:Uncharacterized protein n=1 Tax=Lithospermum erythrorhizon TaxID=34254 RepID=A0AAV3P8Y6_LITER